MSVEKYSKDKFRVRQLVNGERKTVRVFDTREEAEAFDVAFVEAAVEAEDEALVSLQTFGPRWLDKREKAGIVSVEDDRSRWRTHVEPAAFYAKPLVSITSTDLVRWIESFATKQTTGSRGGHLLSPRTVKKTVQLLKQCFDAAVPEHLDANPFAKVPKDVTKNATKRRRTETEEPWTWLEPEEQDAILSCEAIPEGPKLIIRFSMLCGLRQGEQFNLRLNDIRDLQGSEPQVAVKKGSRDRTTKGGKMRWLPLIPEAAEVLRRWLELLPSWCPSNPHKLVFPTTTGCRVQDSKHPLYGPDPEHRHVVRDLRRGSLMTLKKTAMTVREFGLAMWPKEDWQHRDRYLTQRAGTALQRLGDAALAVRERGEGPVRWALTEEGRKLLRGSDKPTRWKRVDLFPVYLAAAGIIPKDRHDGRHVRWHDLRHTCGASLVGGWWGRRWSLEEVQSYLGHESIQMTQRYAHLSRSTLKKAAGSTGGGGGVGARDSAPNTSYSDEGSDVTAGNHWAPPARVERTTFGLGKGGGHQSKHGLRPHLGQVLGQTSGHGGRPGRPAVGGAGSGTGRASRRRGLHLHRPPRGPTPSYAAATTAGG
jgi:integrase